MSKKQPETNKKLLKWASIFKAETLEELEQLAGKEEVFENMVLTLKKLSEDEKIRMQCEAREDYERCLLSEYSAGKREGIEEGIEKGMEQGTEITQKKLLHNLMEFQKITEDEARKMLGI